MENPSVAPHVDDRAGTSDGRLGLVLGIISIAAAVYAGWLSKIKLDSLYSCDATVFNSCKDQKAGCNLVFSSPWSEIAGYPVTVFATAFYVALVVLGLLWTAKSEWVPGHYRPVLLGAGLMAVAVTVAMAGYATIEFHTFSEFAMIDDFVLCINIIIKQFAAVIGFKLGSRNRPRLGIADYSPSFVSCQKIAADNCARFIHNGY